MITRFVKIQLLIFTILTLIATYSVVFVYAEVPRRMGIGEIEVTAVFTDGAGIYVNSNVTSRGVEIGRVTDVQLVPGGVEVRMSLDEDHPVGSDARAEIHSVSAVGEQYVDLISERRDGPYLTDGDVIPPSRTSVPIQVAQVLDKVGTLLTSIPEEGMRTLLDEGSLAFENLGPELSRLVDSTVALLDAADRNYAETEQLIRDVGPLLDIQVRAGNDVRSYFADLASFTGALREVDPQLREALRIIGPAAPKLSAIFDENRTATQALATNMTTMGQLLGTYRAGLEQLLVTVPLLAAQEQIYTRGHRGGKASFDLEVGMGCTTGYNPWNRRDPWDLSDAAPEPNTYCKVPQDDPRVVRGARNVPCQEGVIGRRAATVEQCRSPEGYQPMEGSQRPTLALTQDAAPQLELPTPLTGPPGADEPLFIFGAIQDSSPEGSDRTWQSLLTGPLER